MTLHANEIIANSQETKGHAVSAGSSYTRLSLVRKNTYSPAYRIGKSPLQREPNARERRAARDKLARLQRQKDHFPDATAFAYFKGWPLEHRITITWAACFGGERIEGNIIGLNDTERNKHLRAELARLLRKAGYPLACIWSRDEGARLGLHVHLGLYWPLPDDELVKLLTRLTGSPASYARLGQGVTAQSECGGWQIKRNTAVSRLASAQRWTGYLVDQGERHLIVPKINGKVIGVSRAIHYAAVEAQRAALDAWKRDVGWEVCGKHRGPLRGAHIAPTKASGILPNDFGKICEGSWAVVEAGDDGISGPRRRQKAIGRLM